MSTFVLGPSKWRRGYAPKIPGWVGEFLPTLWRKRGRKALSPLDVRAAMAEAIGRAGHAATVMEAHVARSAESHTALFHRIVREFAIQRFLLFWPAGAQRTGVDVELGFLLNWFEAGKAPVVRILVETAAGGISKGRFESREPGRRSRYYEDLVAYGCPIVEWSDYEELWLALQHHGHG